MRPKCPSWDSYKDRDKILLDVTAPTNELSSNEITSLMKRLCAHLGIAFSVNRIAPSLADLSRSEEEVSDVVQLNAVGMLFGIRFREMTGKTRAMLHSVSDAGPVIVQTKKDSQSSDFDSALVLKTKSRSRVLLSQNGVDRVESVRWFRKNLQLNEDKQYRWLLVQPMLAAENASRFHYQTGTQSAPLKPLQRFFKLLKPEAADIRTIVVFSIVIGLLSLTLPLAVEAVVNTIAFGRYLQPLFILAFIVMAFLGFRAALNVLMSYVSEIIQRKLFVRTVEDLSYRLTRVPLSVWRAKHGPELVNRFFDIVTVQKVTSKLLLDTLMLFLQTVIGLAVLAFYHPFLLGYDIGLLAMMSIVLYFLGRGAIKTATDESQLKYDTAAWLQEIVRHPSTYKFNNGLGFALNRADELAAEYINERTRHFRILIRQLSFTMAMQVVAATVLLALGGYLVIIGELTLGQLVAAELIVTVILGSFAKFGKDLESFYDLMAAVDKLGKLFDLPVEPVDRLQLVRTPGPNQISLVKGVLDSGHSAANVNFIPGKTYALYGASELRRSKLLEVFVGQNKLTSGHVLLNDFRVDALSAESLQEKVSLVRDIELFNGSVDENLRMGRANIGSAKINEIVNTLGFRKIVSSLPEGFGTKLNISGYPLSPGEAIRLVIARALIAEPGILFVDGLLDRLSDEDAEDLLPRLTDFSKATTIIVGTGRRAIAKWAEQCLDMRKTEWELEKFDG